MKSPSLRPLAFVLSLTLPILHVACSGDGAGEEAQTYSISGTVSGLTGSGLVLVTPGQPEITVLAGSTRFAFPQSVPAGTAYAVSVIGQPFRPSEQCTVRNGAGTVSAADVNDVAVECAFACDGQGLRRQGARPHGITQGEPDGGAHPYVAAILRRDSPGDAWATWCTGSLADPRVVVTAAHCFVNDRISSSTRFSISFDPVIGPSPAVIEASEVVHPQFAWATWPLHDGAVILLSEPVCVERYARLPPSGVLGALESAGLLDGVRFETVGYGVTAAPDPEHLDLSTAGTRRATRGTYQSLSATQLTLSMSAALGDGGSCYHDSGGPHLFPGTDLLASQAQDGDPNCLLTDATFRLDTPDALGFLGQFLVLPDTMPICHAGADAAVTVEQLTEHLLHGDKLGPCGSGASPLR